MCAELARRGWAGALTRDGLARTDVLAVDTETRTTVELQVKAVGAAPSWQVGAQALLPAESEREWFVMVHLGEPPAAPRSWVLPRNHLAAAAWLTHQAWLHDEAAKPGTRNTPVERARVDPDVIGGYEDRWDLLGRPAPEVPVMLPGWMRGAVARYGLREGHPWLEALPGWSVSEQGAAPTYPPSRAFGPTPPGLTATGRRSFWVGA